jgi:hypothetical protein
VVSRRNRTVEGNTVVVQVRNLMLETKSEGSPSILRSGMRPWSPVSKVARVLQSGRTTEGRLYASYRIAVVEAESRDDGNAQIAAIPALARNGSTRPEAAL